MARAVTVETGMWTKLYDLDGRCVDTFTDINALKDRVADQCETLSEHVSIDDQYDASGDCVEFAVLCSTRHKSAGGVQ